MIVKELLNPDSIVVVGGSNELAKPGGRVLKNILDAEYNGDLYVVNPKESEVQGVKCINNAADLPQVDLAIIAIASKYVIQTVELLAKEKGTKGFIVLSAGFSEIGPEGKEIEDNLVELCNEMGVSLIGPNCTGVMTPRYKGSFAGPMPELKPQGVDFVTGSGATAVFILETAIPMGISFASVFSVGNSAQMGVEEVLRHWDETFDPESSSKVKLIYIEQVHKPDLFLKHCRSLINKGCKIAAVKSGTTDAGSRAVSSHTGALAGSDVAVDALFRKAGIVRCYGRDDLAYTIGVFMHKELSGRNIAVVTHAGGPGVMLTDALSKGGMKVPHIEGPDADELKAQLFHGSSVANPIDFIATGTAEQLGIILEYIDNKFDNIDGTAVIFGTPGLFDVTGVYKVLHEKMNTCKKPIFPILPSVIQAKDAIEYFKSQGRIYFQDEVKLGTTLAKVFNNPEPAPEKNGVVIDIGKIRNIIDNAGEGYLQPSEIQGLLDAAGIARAKEMTADTVDNALSAADEVGFPLVMKVVGPVHKSDVGGVKLNIQDSEEVEAVFNSMMKIDEATGVLMQPMLSGTELFAGANYEPGFGHLVLCGLGGIFIEVLKDVASGLVPISKGEALSMIRSIKSYALIKGVRGQEGVDEDKFADIITRLSALLEAAPEIKELDLNPLLGKSDAVVAVDARIKI